MNNQPMGREEMEQKMFEMQQERNRIDAEARARFTENSATPLSFRQIMQEPMGREEMEQKMFEMQQERNRIDAEARAKFAGKQRYTPS